MPLLATLEEVTPFIKKAGDLRDGDEDFVTLLLGAATRRIVRYTRRNFFPDPTPPDTTPVTKTFKVRGSNYVSVPDLRSVTAIDLNGAVLIEDEGYELWGEDDEPSHTVKLLYLPQYVAVPTPKLTITGLWGFDAVPEDLKESTCTWVARAFKKRDANYADVVQQGIDAAMFQYFKNVPDEIKMTMDSYKRGPRIAII